LSHYLKGGGQMENPLKEVGFPELPGKPRIKGMTVISFPGDSLYLFSPPLADQYFEMLSPYIDAVKLRHSMCVLYPVEWVISIIRICHKNGIFIYPGGIVSEIAGFNDKMETFYKASKELGFDGVELSENMMPVADRSEWIKEGRSYGLEVVYEYGQKYAEKPVEVETAVRDLETIMAEDIKYLVLERAEIDLYKEHDPAALDEIVNRIGHDRFVLEAGPNKFPEYPTWLINRYGIDVSMANIMPNEAYRLQEYKMGLDRLVNYSIFTKSSP